MARRLPARSPLRIRKSPRLRSPRAVVTRAEFNKLIDRLNERGAIIDGIQRELDVQFKRIAQIQVELDAIRRITRTRNREE